MWDMYYGGNYRSVSSYYRLRYWIANYSTYYHFYNAWSDTFTLKILSPSERTFGNGFAGNGLPWNLKPTISVAPSTTQCCCKPICLGPVQLMIGSVCSYLRPKKSGWLCSRYCSVDPLSCGSNS